MQSFIRKSVWATVWAVTMAITVWFCLELADEYPAILALLILAAFVESISLVYARQAWRHGNVVTAIAALWITGLSLITLIISESSYWSSAIEGIHEQVTRDKLLREGVDIVREKQKERYASLASGKTADQIQAEIDAQQLNELFKRSSACTDVTQPDSRSFCQGYFKLKADHAAAKEAAALEGTVWKASTTVETAAMQRNFYEAARLGSENIGGSVRAWILGIVAVLVLFLESLRLLALYIGTAPDRPRKPQEASKEVSPASIPEESVPPVLEPTQAPETTIKQTPPAHLVVDNTSKPDPKAKIHRLEAIDTLTKRWMKDRADSARIERGMVASDLHADYSAWCKAHKIKPANDKHFGRSVRRLEIKTGRGAGGVAVYGLRLREVAYGQARAA